MKTRIAASLAVLCVTVLLADYVIAMRRPNDSKNAAERVRITAARLARKNRDGAIAWLLIASAALFFSGAGNPARSRLPAGPLNNQFLKPAKKPAAGRIARPTRDFVEDAVAQLGGTKESTIPLLQAIQSHYRYLPDEALRRLCELTEITPAEIAGTSSFYVRFRRTPVGEHIVRVCHGTACHVAGARQINDELRRYLAIPEGTDTDPARQFTIEEVACLGCCSLAPVLMVDGHPAGKLTPTTACQAVRDSS